MSLQWILLVSTLLDKGCIQKYLWGKPFSTLGFSSEHWGTIPLIFLEDLLFNWKIKHTSNLFRDLLFCWIVSWGTPWYPNRRSHRCTLGFIFGPGFLGSALDFIFSPKPFLKYSICAVWKWVFSSSLFSCILLSAARRNQKAASILCLEMPLTRSPSLLGRQLSC